MPFGRSDLGNLAGHPGRVRVRGYRMKDLCLQINLSSEVCSNDLGYWRQALKSPGDVAIHSSIAAQHLGLLLPYQQWNAV